jgi:hypothetical protein
MILRLLLADSEVASVASVAGELHLRFAAACMLRSEPGTDAKPTPGFGRGLGLRLQGAQIVAAQEPLFGRVSSGRLRVGGRWLDGVSIPFAAEEPVQLELTFAHGAGLEATGNGVVVGFEAGPQFSESLAC